jgi:hypothetical protein
MMHTVRVVLSNASESDITGNNTSQLITKPPFIHSIDVTTYKRDYTALYTYVTTRVTMKPYAFLSIFTLKLTSCSLRKKKGKPIR